MIRIGTDTWESLPTLRRHFFARFGVGAVIALAIVLATSLFLADALAARWAARALLQDLEDGLYDAVRGGMGGAAGMGGSVGMGGAGGTGGAIRTGGAMGMGMRRMMAVGGTLMLAPETLQAYEPVWPDARRIQSSQATYGSGRVPWTREPVVWAARRQEDGGEAVQVVWTRLSAVRAAAAGTYSLVAAATIASFAVGACVTDIGVKKVAQAVRAAANTSRQMAEGDFTARMSVGDTRELAELSAAANHLAESLDHTLTQLRSQNEELARLERSQREFVADASHELRAPLTAMAITLDAAADGLMSEEERAEAWLVLRSEVRRLSRTVTELLDLSRIESGREPLNVSPTDVGKVIEGVYQWYQSLPGALPSFEAEVHSPEGQPLIALADGDALHRCVVNFVDNAIRATSPTGRISIWAHPLDDGRIGVGVTDTGEGMTPEEVGRAWERFSRSERARAKGSPGSGLGLAIVRALVMAMGGEVGLESDAGKGTTAWIRLRSERPHAQLERHDQYQQGV
ncbi:MAG TPA: HAMP domain-containing sensor histidine kinase [Bacillota bacterium]|jgi:signal transduction histidine kinase|nr:HAMP domain-containing sensor histidine kinase [Bacillota bacterium]